MALFPAYAKQDIPPKPPAATLAWLSNASCPPEIGQQPPAESGKAEDGLAVRTPQEGRESLQETVASPPESRKKKKKKKEKKHKKKGKKTRKDELRESDSSFNEESAEKIMSSSKSVFLEGLQGIVKPEEAFFVSTDGDLNNRALATTHYTQLASYKTRAKGELGSRHSSHNSKLKKKITRYFKKSSLRTLYADATPVRRLLPSTATTTALENYVPLSLTHAEETKVKSVPASTVNLLGIYDAKTEQYISGTGGLTLDDEVETCQDPEYEMWQAKAKKYNEQLGKEPFNVALWLEFVRFQDSSYKVLYRGDGDKDSGEGKKHKVTHRALAERKISILDSAIKKNIRNLELCFERLEIGRDLWDDKKLKQEWDTLVFSFPNKIRVWHKYLAYVQTHFTSFSLTSAVRTFGKCTERLQQMRDGVFLTHAPPADIGRCLVDVAIQLAHVWRQGGHMERSIALFQALVELNLFCPKHSSTRGVALEAKLALFEPFWDSRAARFGEESAVGWAQVMERREPVQFPEVILEGMIDEEDDVLGEGGTTSGLWLALETCRERRHWLPWEQDPEDCEDPERMVPLEDILPHLFTLTSEEEKFYLVLQFLRFFGVPDIEDATSQGLPNPKNPRSISTKTGDIFKPLVIETLYDANLFGNHFQKRQNDMDKIILSFDAVGPSVVVPACDDYYHFLCRVIQRAVSVFESQHRQYLTLLHIKLLGAHYQAKALGEDEGKCKSLGKEIKKQIKSILKQEEFRMCIPVYQEYGKVEEAMGHVAEAEKVYVTALTIGTTSGKALEANSEDFRAVMDLFLSYIHLEMNQEIKLCSGYHSNNILQSICSLVNEGRFRAPDGSPASGGNLLKTKKKLLQLQDQHNLMLICTNVVSETEKENENVLAIKAVTFLALIQLLTIGFRPACLVFESTIEKVSNAALHRPEDTPLPDEGTADAKNTKNNKGKIVKAKILECLYEDYLWIIEASGRLGHLVRDGSMSPVCLRSVVAAALKVAPENPRFLLLLAQNQSWRNLVSGLETLSSESCSIVTLVSQLLPHIQKTINLITHTSDGMLSCGHRLENVLEQGVRRPPGSHCPLLWRLYLALVAATRPKGLKNLVYRALVQCPGVKSVYLDCVRLLPGMLREVVKLLTEKGMRVRLPLEELQVLTEKELEFEEENDSTNSRQ
ncbi:Protein NRDE2 [Chionoecetes opilio]|uniref:Protein NRDE2 n=1 Tax=Chionoecetes opilio TaxID=41210 RepID=A0A8J4YT21_CHIOP|nr:Protein NRDE2 [Chionoecetes opilio]